MKSKKERKPIQYLKWIRKFPCLIFRAVFLHHGHICFHLLKSNLNVSTMGKCQHQDPSPTLVSKRMLCSKGFRLIYSRLHMECLTLSISWPPIISGPRNLIVFKKQATKTKQTKTNVFLRAEASIMTRMCRPPCVGFSPTSLNWGPLAVSGAAHGPPDVWWWTDEGLTFPPPPPFWRKKKTKTFFSFLSK